MIMDTNAASLIILPTAPLLGVVLSFIVAKISFGKARVPKSPDVSSWIATTAISIAFASAVFLFTSLLSMPEDSQSITVKLADWFSVGAVRASFILNFDYLSAIMALFITGAGVLIHLYAIFCMKRGNIQPSFFVYMNQFIFFALILVLSDNLPFAFIGWTGIGLCSYMLIGFRSEQNNEESAKKGIGAGQKALIVNVISDGCLLLVACIVAIQVGVLGFVEIEESVKVLTSPNVEIAIALLAVGAMLKGVLLPLCVWLPSTMRMYRPTLILAHVVTMVASCGYLLVRMDFLYARWNIYW